MKSRGFGRIYQPQYKDKRTGLMKTSRVWWIEFYHKGTQCRESSGSMKAPDAKALLKVRLAAVETGEHKGPQMKKTCFADLEKFITDDYQIKGNRSGKRMQRALATLRIVFGNFHAQDITYSQLQRYAVTRIKSGIQPASVAYDLAILRRAFRVASRAGFALCPPFPTIQFQNARQGFFEEEEFKAILAHLPVYLRPVMTFAYYTGWRAKSEIIPLEWRQVDFTAGTVRLDTGSTKNKTGRVFMFKTHPALLSLLRAQWTQTQELQMTTGRTIAHVFHRHGKPIKDYTTAWKLARTRAGLASRVVHDFRRTAVRNLRRAGVPEHTAMALTGHKTRHVFDRYDIVNEIDLTDAVSKLANTETAQHRMKALEQQLAEQAAELSALRGEDEQGKFKQSQDVFGDVGAEWEAANLLINGAGDRDRTGKGLLGPRDFKSLASANFATPAAEAAQWPDFNIEV